VVTALWASSKGLHSLIFGLNRVNHVTETRGYFKRRFLCLGYTFLLLIALLFTLLLYVIGRRLLYSLGIGTLFAAALLTAFISVLYLVLPNCKTPILHVIPGAACAAGAWLAFSALFSYYVNLSVRTIPHSSLIAVLLGTLWLYFCMAILLCGAYLNRLFFPFSCQNG
ncbi:MAG: YihY/virulence factor BrkB family protein, partial [Oscillospiraceae bacterium]|nr:YihY/virulence factor BrkB family protein [Oscillospiraceae bacterium]